MKNALITIALLASSTAFADLNSQLAGQTVNVKLLQNARIVSVSCQAPDNINHDEALVGKAIVRSETGRTFAARLIVGRLGNTSQDARQLCEILKKAQRSQGRITAVVSIGTDFSTEEGKDVLNLHGVANVRGLN